MGFNAKHRFQAHLRACGIPYTTEKDVTIINHVTLLFLNEHDTVTIRDSRTPNISFTTPYSMPSSLLTKYEAFKEFLASQYLMSPDVYYPAINN